MIEENKNQVILIGGGKEGLSAALELEALAKVRGLELSISTDFETEGNNFPIAITVGKKNQGKSMLRENLIMEAYDDLPIESQESILEEIQPPFPDFYQHLEKLELKDKKTQAVNKYFDRNNRLKYSKKYKL